MREIHHQIALIICALARFAFSFSPFQTSNPFQFLEAMGMREKNFFDSPRVTLGEGKHRGDSPIYYIKLPPMPFVHNVQNTISDTMAPNKNSFLQVDVDFVNNGKPEQIFHWNYKPNIPMNTPEMIHSSKPIVVSEKEFKPVVMPAEIPLIATKIMKASQDQENLLTAVSKPIISLSKNFFYNGRPNSVYIWKPQQPKTASRFKHHYFKHFNY